MDITLKKYKIKYLHIFGMLTYNLRITLLILKMQYKKLNFIYVKAMEVKDCEL